MASLFAYVLANYDYDDIEDFYNTYKDTCNPDLGWRTFDRIDGVRWYLDKFQRLTPGMLWHKRCSREYLEMLYPYATVEDYFYLTALLKLRLYDMAERFVKDNGTRDWYLEINVHTFDEIEYVKSIVGPDAACFLIDKCAVRLIKQNHKKFMQMYPDYIWATDGLNEVAHLVPYTNYHYPCKYVDISREEWTKLAHNVSRAKVYAPEAPYIATVLRCGRKEFVYTGRVYVHGENGKERKTLLSQGVDLDEPEIHFD